LKVYLISGCKKRQIELGDYSRWLSGKSAGSQLFISPAKIDFSQLESVTAQEWLDKNIDDINDAEITKTIFSQITYVLHIAKEWIHER